MKPAFLLGLALALCATAPAASISVPLFGPGFECQNSFFPGNCGVSPTYQWGNGDYIGQTATGTPLLSANQISLSLNYINSLDISQTQTYDVIVNGTAVGSFSIAGLNDSLQYTVSDIFDFSSITGPDFTVLFQITSPTTPGGFGSIGWEHGVESSIFTLSDEGGAAIPEPGTFALMLAPALAGAWALRRRVR